MMNRLKISRTSKTHVSSLPSFKSDRPRSSGPSEPEVNKEEVVLEESGVGDIFQDIFGEEGQEVQPHEVSNAASKPHVRKDDEPEHLFKEEEPPKRQYTGRKVDEAVNPSKATEVESVDLDDLISQVMDVPADDEQSSPKRSTSTPSKDEATDDADFGDALSLIRGDDYEPPADDKPAGRDETGDRWSGADDERSRRPSSDETSTRKPMGGSSVTTTRISYSSKFVPNIPESFYKDLESRLEDLIFKFECLDNEYAALQKISHNTSVETLEIKKIFTVEY